MSNPLFLELVHRLYDSGYSVKVYDFISARGYDPSEKSYRKFKPFWWAPVILRIKFIRRLFIPYINKATIESEFQPDDVVNIHYINPVYSKYAEAIKYQGCKLICTFWGSDYLRASDEKKASYRPLLEKSDRFTMVKSLAVLFEKENPDFGSKIKLTLFGLKLLDEIKLITDKEKEKFKINKSIPLDKTIVALGYNASPFQQHIEVIDCLNKLDEDLKSKIHLLVLLTYGGSFEYISNIKSNLRESGISHSVFENRLSDKEMALTRTICDVVINFQQTDAFSGSVSEFIAGGSIVINGNWLPHWQYDEWGVQSFTAGIDDLPQVLEKVINEVDIIKDDFSQNAMIIDNHFNWRHSLRSWVRAYEL